MKKLSLIALLLLAMFLVACGGGAPEEAAPEEPAAEEETSTEAEMEEEMEDEDMEEEDGDTGAGLSAEDLGGDGEVVDIRYINWDINQFPAYEECAANFNEANPGINVTVENIGWGDYWTGLQTEMIAGNAADVFTNHLAKYPEFVASGQILDIQPWVDRDNVPTDIYLGELEQLWTRDGTRYGLPKDWDTVAVIYNKAALDAAGVTEEELNNATWDPETGGTFTEIAEKIAATDDFTYGYGADYPGSGALLAKRYSLCSPLQPAGVS